MQQHSNWLATIALVLWPVVSICLYRTLSLGQATLWTILAAQLLLPVGTAIKFQMVPQFDKNSIPCLCALIACLILPRQRPKLFKSLGLTEVLIVMNLIGPFITSELNGDNIYIGDALVLPGVGIYDAISASEAAFIILIPFFLGRQYLSGPLDSLKVLQALVVAGLVYSLPMLFEVRFSPQLHYWFYGYYPSEFLQNMRDGGFRPMVFMGHGLLAAFFVMTTVVAAAALWRLRAIPWKSLPPAGATFYLAGILVLCKTLGALVYAVALVPLVRFAKPRLQVRVALVLVILALAYPTLRSFDLVPTSAILGAASFISSQRAESLRFRLNNEDRLLERASQRFTFGWGRYGRSRVYAEWGQDMSTTDGRWIITLGTFGVFGFIAEFGLLSIGVFRAATSLRFVQSNSERLCLGALSLIVAINIFDLLPNSGLMPWTWLLSGALLGRAEALRALAYQKGREPRSGQGPSAIGSPIPTGIGRNYG